MSENFKGILSLMFYREAVEIWWCSLYNFILAKDSTRPYWYIYLRTVLKTSHYMLTLENDTSACRCPRLVSIMRYLKPKMTCNNNGLNPGAGGLNEGKPS